MNGLKKAIFFGLLISLFGSFVSFAGEGMSALYDNSKNQIWMYHTGEENDYGDDILLKNQWKQVWDNWYYFGDDAKSKQNTWAEIDGKWYYFDQWSIMLHDTTTPDGYNVGSDGAWIPDATESQAMPK